MIKNLVFDLGNVLYDINFERMQQQFAALLPISADGTTYGRDVQHPVFQEYERGELSTASFLAKLREIYGISAPDAEILAAWESILVGIPEGMEAKVAALTRHYPAVLLSNTNEHHFQVLLPEATPVFQHLQRLFLSYEMGMRKPEAAIYTELLTSMGWNAAESLMIDDAPANIAAAEAVGMKAQLIRSAADFDALVATLLAEKIHS